MSSAARWLPFCHRIGAIPCCIPNSIASSCVIAMTPNSSNDTQQTRHRIGSCTIFVSSPTRTKLHHHEDPLFMSVDAPWRGMVSCGITLVTQHNDTLLQSSIRIYSDLLSHKKKLSMCETNDLVFWRDNVSSSHATLLSSLCLSDWATLAV